MLSEDHHNDFSSRIEQKATHSRVTSRAFVWSSFLAHTIPLTYAHAGIVVVDLGDREIHIQEDHMTADDFGWRLPFHMTHQQFGLAFVFPTCKKCCRRYAADGVAF